MPEPFSVPEPSVVAPSMNATVPVGVLEPLVATVAVNITEEPDMERFALEARVVVVLTTGPTITDTLLLPLFTT
jgi:hypothetical protein